ncbi:MAG TPA: hypothetical protein VFD01_15025 [Candidatus Dormibacteraeota bacterium]|nr:hypothetical protein [Candidatus Dormibacteraeota bacterium]
MTRACRIIQSSVVSRPVHYLGQQRCPECHRFCRAAGLGGCGPGCDQLVLIADLLGDLQEFGA